MGFSYTFTSVKFLSARKKTSCIQPGGASEILDGVGGRGVEGVGQIICNEFRWPWQWHDFVIDFKGNQFKPFMYFMILVTILMSKVTLHTVFAYSLPHIRVPRHSEVNVILFERVLNKV